MNNPSQLNVENFNTKVFIPNKSGHDFSPAEQYGQPVYATTGLINRFAVGEQARMWANCIKSSVPKDFILVTSLTNLVVIGAAMFGFLHGRINLLLYRNGKYIARTIVFKNLLEEEEETNKEPNYVNPQ